MKRFFILFVLVVLMCNGALCQTDNSVVSTRTGLVKGFMQEGTMAFLGKDSIEIVYPKRKASPDKKRKRDN